MTGISQHVKQFVFARSEGYCEVLAAGCDMAATEIHHRRARGMGSTKRPETNYASNLLAICRRCHLRCEASRSWALDNGFLVRQSANPADVPVWWRSNWKGNRKLLVLLDDGGTYREEMA